jgi:hypothetical protein
VSNIASKAGRGRGIVAAVAVVGAIAAFGIVGGTGLAGHSIGAGQNQYGLTQAGLGQYQYGLNQAGLGQGRLGRFVFLCHGKHRGHWKSWKRGNTIVVSLRAMRHHLRHGDSIGRCDRRGKKSIVFVGPGLSKHDDDDDDNRHRGKGRDSGQSGSQGQSDRKKHDDDDDDD